MTRRNTFKVILIVIAVSVFILGGFYHATIEVIKKFVGTDSFSIQFWGSLFADLIVLAIATPLVSWWLEWRKRPKLELVNIDLFTKGEICIHKADDGYYEGVLQLFIQNYGKSTEKEFYWHLAIPKELKVQLIDAKKEELPPFTIKDLPSHEGESFDFDLAKHNWFFQKFDNPIYPGQGHHFPYEIRVKSSTKERRTYDMYFYFSTDRGICPTLPGLINRTTFRFLKKNIRLVFARKLPLLAPIHMLQGQMQARHDVFWGFITIRFCDDIP